ncbi:MAG: hypothetical protein CMH49_08700 [Myxococcales bacterium]|nr:hypothetical protein [Myxococcales bacterium]
MFITTTYSSCLQVFYRLSIFYLFVTVLFLSACTRFVSKPSTFEPSRIQKHGDLQAKAEHRSKVYINEGSTSPMPLCSDFDSGHDSHLSEALYIAMLQGSKAVVKEQCLNHPDLRNDLLKANRKLNCSSESCNFYDTYRRGPLWFAYYMALMNQAFNRGEVLIKSKVDQFQDVLTSQIKNSKQVESQESLGREVYRQQVKFKLNADTQCIAVLKLFRDQEWRENKSLGQYTSKPWSSTLPNAGDLWAEARPRSQGGYEVLLIERRYVKNTGHGEMLERELLCTSPNTALTILESDYQFMAQELNRDTMRVYVTAKPN